VCVGKPLAVRELRSIVARVALNFDLEFPAGENWQRYEESILDLFVLTLPPFHITFKERRK
jgi:cytochrome P450